MKNILSILIVIVVLGGLVYLARPTGEKQEIQGMEDMQMNEEQAGSAQGSLIALDHDNFDFGEVSMANGKVNHMFKIKNTGNEAITIEKMYTSCMCTTAELMMRGSTWGPYGMPGHMSIPKIGEVLNPGEEAEIETIFDPAAHGPAGIGRIERQVTVENSSGASLELKFVAVVTP